MKTQILDKSELLSNKQEIIDPLPEVIDNSKWNSVGMITTESDKDLEAIKNNEDIDPNARLTEDIKY